MLFLRSQEGKHCLILATEMAHVDVVSALCNRYPELIGTPGEVNGALLSDQLVCIPHVFTGVAGGALTAQGGISALHVAARLDSAAVMTKLVEKAPPHALFARAAVRGQRPCADMHACASWLLG